MLLVLGLVAVGAVFVWRWWRSLAATRRSVASYDKSLRRLGLAAQPGAGVGRVLPVMPKAHLRVWTADVTPQTTAQGTRKAA